MKEKNKDFEREIYSPSRIFYFSQFLGNQIRDTENIWEKRKTRRQYLPKETNCECLK